MADIVAPPTDQPTETTTPTAPQAPDDTTPTPTPTPAAERREAAPVPHTPGGWPAAPLALLTANTAVAGAAAAALTTGPLLTVLAAGGTATALAVGGRVRHRTDRRRGRQNPSNRTAANRSAGLLPRPRTGRTTAGATGTSGRRGVQPRRRAVNPPTGSPSQTRTGARRGGVRGGARGAVQQVRALRDAHRAAAPSRAARREQRTGDRHKVADARRLARRQARQQRATAGGRSPRALAARAATSPKAQARQAKQDAARVTKRAQRGQASSDKVTAKRKELRRQPVRKAAQWRLRRSAARYHAHRAGAGLLALPVLLLGVVSTWLGRKLGLPSLMYPGHRLYRWLESQAFKARFIRDAAITGELAEQEAAIDAAEAEENTTTPAVEAGPDRTVERAPMSHNANTNLGAVLSTAGFNFADAAADMEAQAQNFEPEGMMQVLAAFEAMPEAMHSIARTFQILAERCDAEFPLDKAVGESLNDVFQNLQQAIGSCEEVATTMRQLHESEIRRLEEPRNGEDKWDTTNND